MKIVMATHFFGSHRGGIETVAERLFLELAVLDQDIVWIASDATPVPEPIGKGHGVGIPVFNLVEKRFGVPFPIPTLGGLRRLRKEIRSADLVILHDCLYLINIFAFLFARFYGVPVMIVQHVGAGAYTHGFLSRLMEFGNAFITRPMLRRAERVIFISETTRRYFDGLRFKNDPAIIFNGVDTSIFRKLKSGESKADLRRDLALPLDRPVILFVGRFVEWKGLPVLRHMVEMEPGYSWVFAGWGPIDPSKWNAPNVHVFSELHGTTLAELYLASDVFVLPSLREGFPVVIQEALAAGLPVICGSETANADAALKSQVCGIELIPGNDEASARAFNAAICNLIQSDAVAARKAEERRQFVSARYSWRRAAEKYLEIASQLLPKSEQLQPQTLPNKSVSVTYRDSQIGDRVAQ